MEDWTKRFALAGLIGFFAAVFALPVSCCGFVLVNEHRYGDVETGGPAAILSAMGVALAVGILVAALVWRKTRLR